MFKRTIINKMDKYFETHYSFTIYGARRTGKTTLVKEYAETKKVEYKYIDCDKFSNRTLIDTQDDVKLKQLIGSAKLLILDEAQRVKNIGLNMKIIHDSIPDVKVIATGSSALDLASEIKESMTGRDFSFNLHPLSIQELSQKFSSTEMTHNVQDYLLYGAYPDVINSDDYEFKKDYLSNIVDNYLFKDLLELDLIKKSSKLVELLRVLAYSIGGELTSNNLANRLEISKDTVERYIDLLEQCFIIKRIRPYNKKIINEVKHPYKVYFWDLGVRNALLEDFRILDLRSDFELGGMWENFVFIERVKLASNNNIRKRFYFWRTTDNIAKEYDLIEEYEGKPTVFEIKWGKSGSNKVKRYPAFFEVYKDSELHVINKENFIDWLV
jgi:uncharacterized protein